MAQRSSCCVPSHPRWNRSALYRRAPSQLLTRELRNSAAKRRKRSRAKLLLPGVTSQPFQAGTAEHFVPVLIQKEKGFTMTLRDPQLQKRLRRSAVALVVVLFAVVWVAADAPPG